MSNDELHFNDEFRELILEMDLKYFLNEDLDIQNISEADRHIIQVAFDNTSAEILTRYNKNRKQCRLWLEGIIRLQWYGGYLPSTFKIDGKTREIQFLNFEATGENWAYFEFWQKLERKRKFWKVTWDKITKIGAVLAIILTLIKIISLIKFY